MVPVGHINNEICDYTLMLQLAAFILKYMFLKTSKYGALKFKQVVSLKFIYL